MNTREILSHIPDLRHLDSGMFLLMAGPCVVENETMLRQVAETACRITERLRIPYQVAISVSSMGRKSVKTPSYRRSRTRMMWSRSSRITRRR